MPNFFMRHRRTFTWLIGGGFAGMGLGLGLDWISTRLTTEPFAAIVKAAGPLLEAVSLTSLMVTALVAALGTYFLRDDDEPLLDVRPDGSSFSKFATLFAVLLMLGIGLCGLGTQVSPTADFGGTLGCLGALLIVGAVLVLMVGVFSR